MTTYRIKADAQETLHIADGDTVTVYAGVSIVDPSITAHSASEDANPDNYSGIQDEAGGNNRITVLGTIEGHAGAFLDEGSNTVLIGDGGYAYGANAGVEFYDGGNNTLSVLSGGKVESDLYGVWFGAHPHVDPDELPLSGSDTIHNAGTIEGDRREAVRMVLGGNQIVNSGTIVADLRGEEAILIQSNLADPYNQIINTGTIQAGAGAASVIGGDAALNISNSGNIIGEIDFGAGADRLSGLGTVTGVVYGGDGNDRLIGGTGDVSLDGGNGADYLQGGTGVATFIYNAAAESTGSAIDTINAFDFSKDYIDIAGENVTNFATINTPNALAAGGAGLFTAPNGKLYLFVDANGVAGYQAGADYEIALASALNAPTTNIHVTQSATQGVVITDGQSLTLAAGVSVIDPSVNDNVRTGLTIYAGIQDGDGGNNHVNILGTAEGFVGTWFEEGSNVVTVGASGSVYGFNAGAEFDDGGHNLLTVRAGGQVTSNDYGVWFGAFPHVDYTTLPNAGTDTVINQGLIEGDRRDAIRMVEGGNVINNSGTIQSDFENAIRFDSGVTDPYNVIVNTGSIVAGPDGVAIVSGDAAMNVTNNGTITGDIQFGASADYYTGTGNIDGTVFGGDGNDRLLGGSGDIALDGGNGADYLRGGSGVTTFVYNAASESSATTAIDTIDSFDFSKDQLDVSGHIISDFALLSRPHDLAAHGAGLIEAANGTWYLLIDANGALGYQAGADYDIKLTHPIDLPTVA